MKCELAGVMKTNVMFENIRPEDLEILVLMEIYYFFF